ncbi:uncharacterized protein LOC135365921 [Ornithodoros turicata]|uniref:uncharacterized protein LOC135365921 n=1 Tax=Ornithodoros turicata TaxID=34597 RepID=UPI00313A2008
MNPLLQGIKKKIAAAAQTKAHQILGLWCESIIRHLYWCAKTSSDNGEELLAKWTSVMRHVINVHTHPNALHPRCFHDDTGERLWLLEGTEPFMKLHSILMSKYLLVDIPKLSPRDQTYGLEAYHSLLIHFAPKSHSYTYEGMLARTQIAALHYNFNSARIVLKNDDGTDKYVLKGSKPKKQWVVIPLKENVSYGKYTYKHFMLYVSHATHSFKKILYISGYVDKLFAELFRCLSKWPTYESAERANARVQRPTLCSSYGEKPSIEEVRQNHWSRFQR